MKTLMILITAALAGCANTAFSPTPQYDRAKLIASQSSTEDVKFCGYEADKVSITSHERNILSNAVEVQEERMRLFNACMDYRRK